MENLKQLYLYYLSLFFYLQICLIAGIEIESEYTMWVSIKLMIRKLTPKIHNLPQVIYIKWFDFEWFIEK